MSKEGSAFAWLLNLDAELELANPGHNASAKLAEQLEQYRRLARNLLAAGDVEITEPLPTAGSLVGRAWCPTPNAIGALRRAGISPEPHPSVDVLRSVNHRRFAFELDLGMPRQHYVESRGELERALTSSARAWLLKRPLSFAGRGQLRWFGSTDARQSAWIEASLLRDGLIVEPLVEPLLEVSVHGFVRLDRGYELGRVCVQNVTRHGVARAVRLAQEGELEASETAALMSSAGRVAEALLAAGYFGPFGIDAFRYRDGGEVGFCALSEINARYTIGFAIGFPHRPGALAGSTG